MSMFIDPVTQAVLYQGGMSLWSNGFWEHLGESIAGWFDDDDRRRGQGIARILPECPSIDTSSPLVYNEECIFSTSSGDSFLVARDLEFAAPGAISIIVDNYVQCADVCSDASSEGCVGFEFLPGVGGNGTDCQLKFGWEVPVLPTPANETASETTHSSEDSEKSAKGRKSRAMTKSPLGPMDCGGSVAIGNSTFHVGCSYEFYGVPEPGSVLHDVPLRLCLEACEQDTSCATVSFLGKKVYKNLDEAEGSCVFQSSVVAGRHVLGEENGRLIGAYKKA